MVTTAIAVAAAFWIVIMAVFLGRLAWRYPLSCTAFLLTFYMAWFGGIGAVIGLVLIVAAVLVPWRLLHRRSFDRVLRRRLRSEGRRFTLYGPRWRRTMDFLGLARVPRGGGGWTKVYRPKLKKVRSELWRDFLHIKMLVGQCPADFEKVTDQLAHTFGAHSVRVWVPAPGRLVLEVIHYDPLVTPIAPPLIPDIAGVVDLARVLLGRAEGGWDWICRLLASHWLIAGSTGAGKSSVFWSLIWCAAPAIRNGTVLVYGIDPKGGMEFSKAPAVFTKLVRDNGEDAVLLLEEIAQLVRQRARWLADHGYRAWTPECGMPFVIVAIDELADITAYQPERKLRERANLALQTICSQGRAPGVAVVGQLQDPRKEVIGFRHLFPTRIALRLDEPQQVDMVLGDGVRDRGAFAHEIPASMPGVAWVKVDGQREPERVRAFHITDQHLDHLNSYIASGRPDFGGSIHGTEVS